jgi:hypothetical protein
MNPDSENFDSLRQLLALKRHEIPPPGYFDRFSRDVMARIKSGDTGDELGATDSWLQRLLGVFNVKPVFAGAFGTVVCAFMISGIISSEQTPVMGSATPGFIDPPSGKIPVRTDVTLGEQFPTGSNSMAGTTTLFDQYTAQAVPVSDRFYLPAGRN